MTLRHLAFGAALAVAAISPAGAENVWNNPDPASIYVGPSEPDGPENGAIEYAKLYPEGSIRVSIFPCGGVRITDHRGAVIFEHPAKCPKREDDR